MNHSASILIVSGWRGVGKTALCRQLVKAARSVGLQVGGLLSPARITEGRKTGIEVEDLRSGEHRLLASCLPGELQGVQLGPWIFDDALFQWGNQVLINAVPCDLLVIDELGPLEFESGDGWSEGFRVIGSLLYQLVVVVIRPEYISQFLKRWPEAEQILISNPKEVKVKAGFIETRYINKTSLDPEI